MRRLVLKRETVRLLSRKNLKEAAGGFTGSANTCSACALDTHVPTKCTCTGDYPSLNAPCTVG